MARKLRAIRKEGDAWGVLQWSRANNGAETRRGETTPLFPAFLLQWSRANNGAETCCARFSDGVSSLLQWSRANNGAETINRHQVFRLPSLASMEPRQQWRGNTVNIGNNDLVVRLQWSRANNGAETLRVGAILPE